MNIRDLKTNSECTFRSIECKMKIKQRILSDKGRIELCGNYEYKFISSDSVFFFTISDENDTKVISDFIQRHYYNLAQIEVIRNDNDIFFLHLSFFYAMDRLGKQNIILSDDIKKKLIEKKFVNEKMDIYKQIADNFILTDGNNLCFAYTAGNYYNEKKKSEEIEGESDDEFEISSVEPEQKSRDKKSLKIYGADYSIQISIEGNDFDEHVIAEKIDFRGRNVPKMALAIGTLDFTDRSAYVSSKVKKILSETPGYLDLWNRYADLEGEFLLEKARKVGILDIDRENINMDGDNILVYLKGNYQEKLKMLSNGDYLFVSNEEPPYLVNPDLSWTDYRKMYTERLTGRDLIHGMHVKIIKIDLTGSISLEAADISAECISLSIRGDERQIIRRETARQLITNGEAANPALGLIIDGNLPDGLVSGVKNNRIDPLSDFVINKIFKNEPTPTQREAINIALNTPDIAVIQGPPGTGKTTVITAIIERLNELSDKRKINKGQILITSFQHDAVRNVIERLSINSLPTIKFGTQGDMDVSSEDAIEEWCREIVEKLKEKNPLIEESADQKELLRLHNFYLLSPNNENALSFLTFVKKKNFDKSINEEIDMLIEEFSIHTEDIEDKLIKSVRKIRTTKVGFADDGPDNADEVLEEIETIIDKDNHENKLIIKTLSAAAVANKDNISEELLENLVKAKRILLQKCVPRPFYQVEKPREEIIELYAKIKSGIRKPQNEIHEILFDLLNELNNNPLAVMKAIESYNFVYAATTQQSEGFDIKKAKGVGREEHPVYNTVVVDEAARVNPGDLMVPLAQAERRIILVGDHRQLPHIYDEEIFESLQMNGNVDSENDVKITLFQYLMNNARKLTEKDGIPRTITLDAQYRMHPLLGKFVSKNFYEQYDEGFESPLEESYFKQHLYDKPVVWIKMNQECGKAIKRGTSRVRECEANYIVNAINRCMQSEEGKNLTYGVISFYSAQVQEIKHKLGRLADKVRVGSVDAFQGMEFDVIFLSVVRSRSKLPKDFNWELFLGDFSDIGSESLKQEQEKYISDMGQNIYGFLTSENRLCVSLSRQKKLLIIVGNSDFFVSGDWSKIAEKCVPAMKRLYELCEKEGVIKDGNTESV